MQYASDLTTVEAVIRQLDKADPGAGVSAQVAQYSDLFTLLKTDIIPMASAYIQQYTGRSFVPYTEEKRYYHYDMVQGGMWMTRHGRYRLLLDEDLLVTSGVVWNGTALSSTAWREHDPHHSPFYMIEFDPDNTTIELDTDTFTPYTAITGTWGYHTNTSQMYSQVDASVTINGTATNLSVTDAALYETLQYIRIESELMQIMSRNETTDVLTVRRGVNGTTATSHTAASVSKFTPVQDIRQAATRLAAWSYQHRNDLGDRIQFTDGTTVITQMPAFVREVLANKKRITVSVSAVGFQNW